LARTTRSIAAKRASDHCALGGVVGLERLERVLIGRVRVVVERDRVLVKVAQEGPLAAKTVNGRVVAGLTHELLP
jgi:hypothetical protein